MRSLAGHFWIYSCRACHNEDMKFPTSFSFFFFFSSRGISTVIAVVHYPSLVTYLLFRFPRNFAKRGQKYGTCISMRDHICRQRKCPERKCMRYLIAYYISSSTFILNRSIKSCIAAERHSVHDIEIMSKLIMLSKMLSKIERCISGIRIKK